MPAPLTPDAMFPAGRTDIHQRTLMLASGIRVRIAESGPADGPPVVMLPGWGGALYMYRHGFDALARRGCRVIAMDLRGFGLSDRPAERGAYTLGAYEADVAALLDALALPRVTLVGQSMGGGLALRYAIAHPERVSRLALINPTGLIALRFLPLLRTLPRRMALLLGRRAVPRRLVEFILRYLAYGDASKVTEQDIDEYWAPTQLPRYVYAARAALGEFDWRPVSDAEAASLSVRTIVVLGKSDRLVPNTDKAARRLANATVHWFPGGHCAHEEQPGPVYRLIGDLALEGENSEKQ